MKNLVIGAGGFVGKYLIDALNTNNDIVYATKLASEKANTTATWIDLDICNYTDVCNVIKDIQPDVIFHLAAQSSVKLSWEKPQLTAQINIIGALNILEAVKSFSLHSKVVVIGSSEQYGQIDYNTNVSESATPKPTNIYAVTKYAQENFATLYVKAYGLHVMCTRSFNHIGPGQAPQFVVADFCNQVAEIEKGLKEPTIYVGNLNSFRDFSDVRDVVQAYITIAKKGTDGEIYNVGSGNAIQISEILKLILSNSTSKINIVVDEKKYRPIDVFKIQADNGKILSLGWMPKKSINESIIDTLNYFRSIK